MLMEAEVFKPRRSLNLIRNIFAVSSLGQCFMCPAGVLGQSGPPGPQGVAGRDGRDGRDAPPSPQGRHLKTSL